MFDREDYAEFAERQKKQKANGHSSALEFLAQAEVHQRNLTGQPEWDRFLSYIQSTRDRIGQARLALKEKLCDISLVDNNEIMAVKMDIVRLDSLAEAFDAVLSLPKDIMETGEKAREELDKIK